MELIQELLQKENYIQPKDEYGSTPLHYAVGMGNLEVCKLIIEKFHDKNPYDDDLLTPLHIGNKKFWSKILPLDDINLKVSDFILLTQVVIPSQLNAF